MHWLHINTVCMCLLIETIYQNVSSILIFHLLLTVDRNREGAFRLHGIVGLLSNILHDVLSPRQWGFRFIVVLSRNAHFWFTMWIGEIWSYPINFGICGGNKCRDVIWTGVKYRRKNIWNAFWLWKMIWL